LGELVAQQLHLSAELVVLGLAVSQLRLQVVESVGKAPDAKD
jgi:hypothetical protein